MAPPQRDNFTVIPNVIFSMSFPGPHTFQIYAILRSLAPPDDPKGRSSVQVTVSHSELVKVAHLGHGTVTKSIQDLRNMGLITIDSKGSSHHARTFTLVNIWHKNHKNQHQVPLPLPDTSASKVRPPHGRNSSAPSLPTETPTAQKNQLTDMPSQKYVPHTDEFVPHTDEKTAILDTLHPPHGRIHPPHGRRQIRQNKKEQDTPPQESKKILEEADVPEVLPKIWAPIEDYRARMSAAAGNNDRVAILVDLVTAFTRDPPPNSGGRAAGLLKQAKGDGGQALQALAQACVALRSGDVFSYAGGILRRNGGPTEGPKSIVRRMADMEKVAAAHSGARKAKSI